MELKREKNDRGNVEFAAHERPSNHGDSTLGRLMVQGDLHLARVDKPLLVFKAFYFFFYSALATTFPFLPSYFQQIGLSAYQVQVLSGVRPFIQLFLSPLWGILADRCLPKKMILQFCTFVWLIGTISLAFVEPTGQMCQLISLNNTDSQVVNSTEMQTGFFRRRRALNMATAVPTTQTDLPVASNNQELNRDRFEIVEIPIGSGSGTGDDHGGGSGSGILDSSDIGTLNNSKTKKSHNFITFSASRGKAKSHNGPNLIELNFTIRNELRENSSRLYHIFLGALALVAFEEIFLCPVFFLADAVLLSRQKEEGTVSYSHQKMFGSMGFVIFFLITGTLLNDSLRPVCGHIYADYIINVCFFCVVTIVTLLVLIKLDVPYRCLESKPYERLRTIYYTKHYGSFIAAACFMGFSHTVISNFYAEYLVEATVGHASAATINFFRFLGEPLAFFVSTTLINRAGSINVMVAALVLYMFNHFACSFVTSPWQLIPLGFLEGFTYGSSWVVCVTYLANSTPPDCIATVQGVLQSIYWGLGGSLGLIIGGSLISLIGPTFAFRLFAMLAVLFAVAFTVGLKDVSFRDRNYYTLLHNTFNICAETKRNKQTNAGDRDSTSPHGSTSGQMTSFSFGEMREASDNTHGDWDEYTGTHENATSSSLCRRYHELKDAEEEEKHFL